MEFKQDDVPKLCPCQFLCKHIRTIFINTIMHNEINISTTFFQIPCSNKYKTWSEVNTSELVLQKMQLLLQFKTDVSADVHLVSECVHFMNHVLFC